MRELSRRPKITIKEDEEGDLSIVSENSIQRMYEEFKVQGFKELDPPQTQS